MIKFLYCWYFFVFVIFFGSCFVFVWSLIFVIQFLGCNIINYVVIGILVDILLMKWIFIISGNEYCYLGVLCILLVSGEKFMV